MLKTFIFGIVLGIAAAAGALYAYPAVDQHREASIVKVAPNGGNVETFHVNVPIDRIMIGAQDRQQPLPPGMDWPTDDKFADIRVELFKIRNVKDVVVGVASRAAVSEAGVIDWVLHLPARGSLYVSMDETAAGGGYRRGGIRAGSREFGPLSGSMTERWIADESGEQGHGRIELNTRYVGQQVIDELPEEEALPEEEELP